MAKQFPELVFTRGPQRGQRVPLAKMMNIIGRDQSCDIPIEDEYASRQHARIVVEGNRVRLVNTSNNGTRVNGKTVKDNAVLDNGDTLGFGLECEVRIQLAGGAAPTGAQAPAAPAKGPPPLPDDRTRSGRSREDVKAEEQASKRQLKKPTMVVWILVYLGVFGALFLFLSWLRGGQTEVKVESGLALTDKQIRDYIEEPLPYEIENKMLAADHLQQAQQGYEQWQTNTTEPGHVYRTLHNYKMALAYYNQESFPTDDAIHLAHMQELKFGQPPDTTPKVREGLFDKVRIHYKNAYSWQRQGKWAKAEQEYHLVLRLIPDHTHPINKNVREQLNVVKTQIMKQKARSGPRNQW